MELTEEQKQQLKKLEKSIMSKSLWFGFKTAVLLTLANIPVILLDLLYVHSQPFVFVASCLNIFFIFRFMNREIEKERDRVREEIKKILGN